MTVRNDGRGRNETVPIADGKAIIGVMPSRADAQQPAAFPARRVKTAYEQVADQIHALIFSGALGRGDRLPSEAALGAQFGVSRATVREALRLLAAQNLIRTDKGASGGSFVTLPSVDHISETLNSNISLLTAARDITLDEFLEAREMLEVPAARMAAERHDPHGLHHIHESIPGRPLNLNTDQQFTYNRDFHSAIVEAAGNTLIVISAQPIFSVLQTNLARSTLDQAFHAAINAHHVEIADAIEQGDGDGAAGLMHEHLTFLRPYYEKAWKHAKKELG
jgi:GntR family transcriptional repressor for pyruvate dehydrogenase complex